jgi:antitoxin (DNA-binding transcriptional repressor) of toxin-antitoxin stability system
MNKMPIFGLFMRPSSLAQAQLTVVTVQGSEVHITNLNREQLQKFFMRDTGKVAISFYGLNKIPVIFKRNTPLLRCTDSLDVLLMRQVNIHEAKTQLSQLIAAGEEIVIASYGKPVARLVPLRAPIPRRIPGSAHGKFEIPPAFFEALPDELLDGFEQ